MDEQNKKIEFEDQHDGSRVIIESCGKAQYNVGETYIVDGVLKSKGSDPFRNPRKNNNFLTRDIGPRQEGFTKMAFLAVIVAFVGIIILYFIFKQ